MFDHCFFVGIKQNKGLPYILSLDTRTIFEFNGWHNMTYLAAHKERLVFLQANPVWLIVVLDI